MSFTLTRTLAPASRWRSASRSPPRPRTRRPLPPAGDRAAVRRGRAGRGARARIGAAPPQQPRRDPALSRGRPGAQRRSRRRRDADLHQRRRRRRRPDRDPPGHRPDELSLRAPDRMERQCAPTRTSASRRRHGQRPDRPRRAVRSTPARSPPAPAAKGARSASPSATRRSTSTAPMPARPCRPMPARSRSTPPTGSATSRSTTTASPAALDDDFDERVAHSATASVGMAPGRLPFGWTVGAGYAREDSGGRFDQRFEGTYVRGDVVVPVGPTLALTAGVGYEDIEASQRDVLRDANGVPVIDAGRPSGPGSEPRRGCSPTMSTASMYDAGVHLAAEPAHRAAGPRRPPLRRHHRHRLAQPPVQRACRASTSQVFDTVRDVRPLADQRSQSACRPTLTSIAIR